MAKRTIEVTIRRVWDEVVVVLPNGLLIKVEDASFNQITNIVKSWLRDPYTGSSRSLRRSNIDITQHPIVGKLFIEVGVYDVSKHAESDIKVVEPQE